MSLVMGTILAVVSAMGVSAFIALLVILYDRHVERQEWRESQDTDYFW